MYLGRIVELAPAQILYAKPRHPYTASLLSAVPVPNPLKKRQRLQITGDVPSPIHTPSGCSFHPRCPFQQPICVKESPEQTKMGAQHSVACHIPLNDRIS
jgi:peptide/nickel transport system ATP-binding protein